MNQISDIQDCVVQLIDGDEYHIKLNVDRIYGLYLFDCVCEHLNINEKEFFGIRYIHPKEKQFTWLDSRKTIKYQIKEGPYTFYFAVKFFPPSPNTLVDDQTRYLFIVYIRELILKKKLLCSSIMAQELSSCIVQAEFGDYDKLEDKKNYLNGIYLYPGQDEKFINGVTSFHKQLKGTTQMDCESRFLTLITKIPNYGVESHEVEKYKEGINCLLGIYWGGLLELYDNDTKNLCSWENLISAAFLKKILKLKIKITKNNDNPTNNNNNNNNFGRNYKNIRYRCPTRTATKRIYKAIVETHTFFRRHTAPTLPSNLSFHSKFRFIGKTFSQSKSSLYSGGSSHISDIDSIPSELNDSASTQGSEHGGRTRFPTKNLPDNTINTNNDVVKPTTISKPLKKNQQQDKYQTTTIVYNLDSNSCIDDGPDLIYRRNIDNDPNIIKHIDDYQKKLAELAEDEQFTYYY